MQYIYKMINAEQLSIFCKEFNKLSNIEKSETSLQAFFPWEYKNIYSIVKRAYLIPK